RADQGGSRDRREEGAEGRAQGAEGREEGGARGEESREPEGERAADADALASQGPRRWAMANEGPFLFYSALHGRPVRDPDGHVLHVPTGDLHLVHVDVGFRGLVRRLGWSTTMGKEQLISWRYVQPLTLAATGDTLQLTVTRKELGRLHPAELADILTELDGRERESLFRALAPEAAARALTEVEPRVRQRLIAGLPAERAADIVER